MTEAEIIETMARAIRNIDPEKQGICDQICPDNAARCPCTEDICRIALCALASKGLVIVPKEPTLEAATKVEHDTWGGSQTAGRVYRSFISFFLKGEG